jgi:hypothetical protein
VEGFLIVLSIHLSLLSFLFGAQSKRFIYFVWGPYGKEQWTAATRTKYFVEAIVITKSPLRRSLSVCVEEVDDDAIVSRSKGVAGFASII